MSANTLAKQNGNGAALVESALIEGDLAKLTPAERLQYYRTVCESTGLNPMTKPFQYVPLNGKLTLYATKGATDQLRKLHGVSIEILRRETVGDIYRVVARATDRDGRMDEDEGAVSIKGLSGNELVNATLKALTKAKRRVTLSICGLGLIDETELETVPGAVPVQVDPETGEIYDAPSAAVQSRQTFALLCRLEEMGIPPDESGHDRRVAVYRKFTKRAVNGMADLSDAEVAQLIDSLSTIAPKWRKFIEGLPVVEVVEASIAEPADYPDTPDEPERDPFEDTAEELAKRGMTADGRVIA